MRRIKFEKIKRNDLFIGYDFRLIDRTRNIYNRKGIIAGSVWISTFINPIRELL
jgi:hypothetical protein